MRHVLIVKCRAESFRVPFYEALGDRLAKNRIRLTVAYGQPDGDTPDEPDPPPFRYGRRVQNIYMHAGRRSVVWQPVLKLAGTADLVIVQQGNKNLVNHALLLLRRFQDFRLAFWGHGRNFQAADPNSACEVFKRWSAPWVDHWFAYTEKTRSVLLAHRVPDTKITVVNNAIDTSALRALYDSAGPDMAALKQRLAIAENTPVGIYCGRMYDIKNIPFLLRAVGLIKQHIPAFHFVAMGEGEHAQAVRSYAAEHAQWFHYVGRAVGREKAAYFRLASTHLAPGAVGLAVVDSFATRTPLITTAAGLHGPEIGYLLDGVNGRIIHGDEKVYASEVARLLQDPECMARLRDGCQQARDVYTLDAMVQRFTTGVHIALQFPQHSAGLQRNVAR